MLESERSLQGETGGLWHGPRAAAVWKAMLQSADAQHALTAQAVLLSSLGRSDVWHIASTLS